MSTSDLSSAALLGWFWLKVHLNFAKKPQSAPRSGTWNKLDVPEHEVLSSSVVDHPAHRKSDDFVIFCFFRFCPAATFTCWKLLVKKK